MKKTTFFKRFEKSKIMTKLKKSGENLKKNKLNCDKIQNVTKLKH